MKIFLVFAITAVVCYATTPPLVLEDVSVIDGTGKKIRQHQSLVIEDGRISRIVAASVVSDPPTGAQVLKLSGKTVMPGIINGHGHLGLTKGAGSAPEDFSEDNIAAQLSQYERYGVTTVMSLGVNRDLLYRIRQQQEKGIIGGASILTADHGVGVPNGVPKMNVESGRIYRPATAEQAREDVRTMAERHPDLIKVWVDDNLHTLPEPKPSVYKAVIDEAHKQDLRVAAHVFYQADAKQLLEDKVDILAHSIRDEKVDKTTVKLLKSKEVYYIPTLQLEESFFVYANKPEWLNSPFFQQAAGAELTQMLNSDAYRAKVQADKTVPDHQAALKTAMKNLKKLHSAHVLVAFGTDSGATPFRVQGFAEHRELILMVQAGLKPLQAIHCATQVNAQMLHIDQKTGTIAPGKQADILVLEADPSKDIANTQKIHMVLHQGQIVKTGQS